MVHNIDAIFDHGVFRPIEPLALPEGARVRLRVEDENGRPAETPDIRADYARWLDSVAGRWQGNFVCGEEGDFEARESLS